MCDGRLEIIDHQGLGNAAEMGKGVFETTDEIFRRLRKRRFAVGLATVAEHDPKDVRLAPPAGTARRVVRRHDRRTGAEVDLGFLAGTDFHPPHRQFRPAAQSLHESSHAPVAG